MFKVLDQQKIRFLTVFGRVSRIPVSDCFMYNNKVVFAVPQARLAMAIGENANNIKRASEMLMRKVRVVALPRPGNDSDIPSFISSIIHPVEFKNLEVVGEEIQIVANGMENKAEMMGRNKVRLKELQDIAKQYFNKNLRII
ncbi:MAG: hypothetical protein AABW73_01960 [Nanoarchaeota archaeon]